MTRRSRWMATLLAFALIGIATAGIAAEPDSDAENSKPELTVAQQIQRQIPAASAISRKEFERAATMQRMPKLADFSNQSLSAVLMASSGPDLKKGGRHFRLLQDNVPEPHELATEMLRGTSIISKLIPFGPCTLIHVDRITGLTCAVEGDTAKGTVSFRVPELYEGKVDYVAHRRGEVWRIETFLLPGYGLKVVRGEKGSWKAVELEPTP